MTQLTAVSLFAGVGGFDLAMQRNGINVVATVEIDKNARGVLQHQFPEVTHFEDVTKVSGDDLRSAGFIPDRGIITGGFPCQDLSVAGKRAGLAGQRSGLYWEIIRLVDELSPKYLVLENVPGLLSSNDGRDMGIVIGALTERGYGVSWRVLDAQYFGVAQRRRRVFIVGCAGDNGRSSSEILDLTNSLRGDSAPRRQKEQDVASNVVGSIAENSTTDNANNVKVGPLTATGMSSVKGTETSDSHHLVIMSNNPDVANALPASLYHHGTVVNQDVDSNHLVIGPAVRRLTPSECERLQGFPDGWTSQRIDEKKGLIAQADSARYKQMGNAVAVPVVEWIFNRLVEQEKNEL